MKSPKKILESLIWKYYKENCNFYELYFKFKEKNLNLALTFQSFWLIFEL